ncbi:MAG: thiamine-phosphate kinase [Candidatus Omnitrophica bacterium]|nr:thiamine-phosphate kinase [Candidatus Omnitrophota bacterium]
MSMGQLGEFGLIEYLRKKIRLDNSVIEGSGDDCAVIRFRKDTYLLYTCDMIVEGVDFLSTDKPELIGQKALSISLSDIAACGGIPRYAVVAMGFPKKTALSRIKKVSAGLLRGAKEYRVNVVGGDISCAPVLTIDVSVIGVVKKDNLVLRKGARVGDVIFITGSIGGSIQGKHLTFSPRIKEARFLTRHFHVHAMIDVSDGLAQDLGHILTQSKVGARIYQESIPLRNAAVSVEEALQSGEEFELIFTLNKIEANRLIALKRPIFHAIGEITDKKSGLRLVDKKNRIKRISSPGFRHF